MERVNQILQHNLFQTHLQENERAEVNRPFCRHGMEHFLDVARIAEIINLEEGLSLERELIYAAALLHDIGKHIQYEDKTPHEVASVQIAPQILTDCGFTQNEADCIVNAILCHRNEQIAGEPDLRGVLYRADKASRSCFACHAEAECNWKDGKKNLALRY